LLRQTLLRLENPANVFDEWGKLVHMQKARAQFNTLVSTSHGKPKRIWNLTQYCSSQQNIIREEGKMTSKECTFVHHYTLAYTMNSILFLFCCTGRWVCKTIYHLEGFNSEVEASRLSFLRRPQGITLRKDLLGWISTNRKRLNEP